MKQVSSSEEEVTFEHLMNGRRHYDKSIHPPDPPVEVKVQIAVREISLISAFSFRYFIRYYIRLWWKDSRLTYGTNDFSCHEKNDVLCNNTNQLQESRTPEEVIWVPDIKLINCLDKTPNYDTTLTISDHEGNIFLSRAKSAECSCAMDLKHYPMDIQDCQFMMESFAYDTHIIKLKWQKIPVVLRTNFKVHEYMFSYKEANFRLENYTIGEWKLHYDNLKVVFTFARRITNFIYRFYIPTMLLMVFNMGSFWIPVTALPARITLIVTTFLSNTVILQTVTGDTVKASTTSALHVFLLVNIVFMITTMVEFILALHWERIQARKERSVNCLLDPAKDSRSNRCISRMCGEIKERHNDVHSQVQAVEKKHRANLLDRISRVVAPIAYITFCIGYFLYYCTSHSS